MGFKSILTEKAAPKAISCDAYNVQRFRMFRTEKPKIPVLVTRTLY